MTSSDNTENHTKRRARCIMATDSEWHIISRKAKAAQLPISRYVVQRSVADEPEAAQEDELPRAVQRRLARDLLILTRVEELRFRNQGRDGDWQRLVNAAEALLDSEIAAG